VLLEDPAAKNGRFGGDGEEHTARLQHTMRLKNCHFKGGIVATRCNRVENTRLDHSIEFAGME
jgi:hypothetical protein